MGRMRYSVGALLSVGLALVLSTGTVLAAPPIPGSGAFDFPSSLVPSTRNGEAGRDVFLTGTITGRNFEPGDCNPFPAGSSPVAGKCLNFTKSAPQPGEFQRAHPGQTAFTICDPCTIDRKTGSFTLKISYPNPKNLTVTHFTIQDAADGLVGLHGEGSLDFTTGTYTIQYHF
jgi:hypothetical protein